MNKPIFGVAGFPINFFATPYGKKRENIFKWLKELDLDAMEIQCTYGIRMKKDQAVLYRDLAKQYGITLTMHAPYYINLGSANDEVVERSKEELKKAIELAHILDVKRIIFHPGGGYGTDRKAGLERIIKILNSLEKEKNLKNIKVYPEIGGKINQLGSLEEIIEICKGVKFARPCIDLAHLHAREKGSMNSADQIIAVLNKIEKELGRKILEETHFHVYPVDYTEKGEKIHKAFGDKTKENQLSIFDSDSDNEYMPRAEDYIKALKEVNLTPITICEAFNTQEIGAVLMKSIYFS